MFKSWLSRMAGKQRRKARLVASTRAGLMRQALNLPSAAAARPPVSLKGPRDIVRAVFRI